MLIDKFEKIEQCSGYQKSLNGDRSQDLQDIAIQVKNQLENLLSQTRGLKYKADPNEKEDEVMEDMQ